MTARFIDGKKIASQTREALKRHIADEGLTPHLAIILANDNPASAIYVSRKQAACEEVGIRSTLHELSKDCSESDLPSLIDTLNKDSDVDGLFLQLPLPDHINANRMIQAIAPAKDVDGLTPENLGRLMIGPPYLAPCTPLGVMAMLNNENTPLSGKHAVIIGRSLLFGKPMGQLLLQADCTVTHCHSKTTDLPAIARQADILIAAVGQANMVKADWVKQGAIVIDVGINRLEDGTITGDVDFEAVKDVASLITPVPGGVGPMTVASLLRNTIITATKS